MQDIFLPLRVGLTALAFLHSAELHTDVLIQHDFIVASAIGNLKPFILEKRGKLSDLWLRLSRARCSCRSLAR